MSQAMQTRQDLLKAIEGFIVRHDMTATDFGLATMNDRAFVHRLRKGGDVKLKTLDKLYSWMEKQEKKAQRRRAVAA